MTPWNKRGALYRICAALDCLQSKLANNVIVPYVDTTIHVSTVNFQDIVQKYADHSPLDFYLLEHLKLQLKMKRHLTDVILMPVNPFSIAPGTFESDNIP